MHIENMGQPSCIIIEKMSVIGYHLGNVMC